jgi:hypothetical protein
MKNADSSDPTRTRRLILLLDGTWNDDEVGGNATNIVRLRDLIADSLDPLDVAPSRLNTGSSTSLNHVSPRTFANREYIVFYERGVGTGPFDRVRGGGFGLGLDRNIRRAYRFLSFHYLAGDEIFIFGFSRGSYTARSLTGYLGAIGLLRCDTCTEARERLAWSFYRTPPNDRLPGVWKELEPYMHPRETVRVRCLGLFDTVGAMGVPLQGLWRLNRQQFEFHDVELSSLVDIALHALAIDEHRRPFEPSLWRRNKFKRTSAKVEQVWFPGVHADIGGGYLTDDQRLRASSRPLDDLALDWMIKRLLKHVADFPITQTAWLSLIDNAALGPQHDSRTWKYKLWRNAIRSIGNTPALRPLFDWRDVSVGYDPRSKSVNESVHIRAIQYIATKVEIDGNMALYMPINLVSCLPNLEALYLPGRPPEVAPDTLMVTAMDSETVQPGPGPAASSVYGELVAARKRLQREVPALLNQMGWVPPGNHSFDAPTGTEPQGTALLTRAMQDE